MKKRSLLLMLALMLVFSLVLAACGKKEETDSGKDNPGKVDSSKLADKQELRWTTVADIKHLDTAVPTDAVSFVVLSNVFEGLYVLGQDDKLELGVAAEEPKIDGKVWTFKLRTDAKWSNGDPVTADDFVFGWRHALDKNTKSEYASFLYPIKNAKAVNEGTMTPDQLGVKAVDKNTLEVTWETVYPYAKAMLSFATFMPQNEKVFKEQGEKFGKEANAQVYNGPFVLDTWTHAQGWVYKKNDKYWDAKNVHLTMIDFKIVKDDATRLQLYEKGEIDRANLVATQVPMKKGKPDFEIENDVSTFFLKLNQKNDVLKNVNARKAIARAFDKQAFVDNILNNGSLPIGYLVPSKLAYDENHKDFREGMPEMSKYDVKAAQEFWTKAKTELGKDAITLTILTSDTSSDKNIGIFMQAELQKNLPGLKVELKAVPFQQQLDLQDALDYDIATAGWGPDYPDPMTFLELYESTNAFNRSMYKNEEFDKIIHEGNTTLLADPAKRWEELKKAEKILIDQDQAIAPTFQRSLSFVENQKVKGYYVHTFGGDWTFKTAYIEK